MEHVEITPDPNNERILCSNPHDPPRNAKKYCQICKKFFCSDCLVDLDIDHLKNNHTYSIDEYYNKFKNVISDKITNIRAGKEQIVPLQKSIKNQIEKKVDSILRQVDEFTNSLTQELFSFNDSVKVNMSKFKENLSSELKEKSLMFKYIENDFDLMLQEMEKNLKNWDLNLRAGKIRIMKDVDSLYGQPEKDIKNVIDNLPAYRDNINPIFAEKQSELDKILAGYKLEEKKKRIREIIEDLVLTNQKNHKIINSQKPKNCELNNPEGIKPDISAYHIPPINNVEPIIPVPSISSQKNIIATVEMIVHKNFSATLKNFQDNTNSIKEGNNYSYIMGIKNNFNSIFVYWNKHIHEVSIRPNHLEKLKTRVRHSPFPFKHCRIVNLGTTAILTGGGNDESLGSTDCFQLTPSIDGDIVRISISEFPSMNDPRERHNMIYLQKYNSIFVCSSFQKSVSTEICNLTERKWVKMRDMNTRRANSTLVFIDDRWIFCISGYIVDIENSTGSYSNSYEVFDMHNTNSGWREYQLLDDFNVLILSAMGCVYLNKNDFILVGGFNGSRYMDTTYHITTENGRLSTIKKINNTLDSGVIFQNSSFIRSGNSYINFDYTKLCELIALK
jgi:hypothetical protein